VAGGGIFLSRTEKEGEKTKRKKLAPSALERTLLQRGKRQEKRSTTTPRKGKKKKGPEVRYAGEREGKGESASLKTRKKPDGGKKARKKENNTQRKRQTKLAQETRCLDRNQGKIGPGDLMGKLQTHKKGIRPDGAKGS